MVDRARRNVRPGAVCLLALLTLAGCGGATSVANDDWPNHGRDTSEQRFSPLEQINISTVGRLGLAWSLDLPGETALEATPLAVRGRLYFSGGSGRVYAVDAVSGKQLWDFDPQPLLADNGTAARMYSVNRGVAFWDGKVFTATRDGRMIALDAMSGKPVWQSKFLLPETRSTSTGAPRIFGDKVIIGNSGADFDGRGYVTALDGRTGRILWRFFIVPGDPAMGFEDEAMAMAAKSWSGQWWKHGGGGNPWNGITYDPEFRQVLIGTGNGGPWNCHVRSDPGKDNLFLSSVVALDADTGKYKWHYQYNPRECWDWKATADIVLAKLNIGGKPRPVLMQAPSNGFFYVIDRSNGKLLSAGKYAKANWASRIDLKTGRPVEAPNIRYEKAPVTIYPSGGWGAHSWQATSYNPDTGLVYIPYMQLGTTWAPDKDMVKLLDLDPGKWRYRIGASLSMHLDPKDPMDGKGALIAWDPVRQKEAWRAIYPVPWQGGVLSTHGGLVFQGILPGQFYAYDAKTGKRLWSYATKLGIIAPPITYTAGGQQYVSVLVGPGGGTGEGAHGQQQGFKYGLQPRRLLTFALDAKTPLPPMPPPDMTLHPVDDPKLVLDPARVKRGYILYHLTCTLCHGDHVESRGGAPDLRESGAALDRAAFRSVLLDGLLRANGMPKFDVSDSEAEDLYQFIRQAARDAKAQSGK